MLAAPLLASHLTGNNTEAVLLSQHSACAAAQLLTWRGNAAYPQVGRLVPTLRGSGSWDLFYMAETIRQELLSPRPQRALEGRSEPQAAEQRLHPRRLLRGSTVRCSDASGGVGRWVPNVPGAKQLISPRFRFVLCCCYLSRENNFCLKLLTRRIIVREQTVASLEEPRVVWVKHTVTLEGGYLLHKGGGEEGGQEYRNATRGYCQTDAVFYS